MMLVPLALVLFAAFVNAEPAINEARPHSNRPGRFLSLPIPQKCANRKYLPALAVCRIIIHIMSTADDRDPRAENITPAYLNVLVHHNGNPSISFQGSERSQN